MYEITSQTITEDYKAEETPLNEWKFQISNGNTGEVLISDALLDSEELATERAMSEFLKNSYKHTTISFSTYRTDFDLNMIINVYGLPYIIKSINPHVDETSITTKIGAVRYE